MFGDCRKQKIEVDGGHVYRTVKGTLLSLEVSFLS